MATLNRDHVIAAMLVTGVVVIVGFASGLGLRTTTSNAQTGTPAAAQAQPGVSTPLPEGGLPQAIQPPVMSMPGTDLPVSEPTGAAQPLPGDAGSVPSPAVTQPALPIVPGQPVAPPTTPGAPGAPGTPNSPGPPPTCLPGVVQQV
ncbi:MAG TPA: hypothetical protein VHC18_17625, partial [Amycolatopsis sp.]|nr:hypothetical protein [Amycolatopsis sp.]